MSQSRVGTLRDQMQKIADLGEVYPFSAISRAMQRALEYQSFGYGALKRILERQAAAPESLPENPANKTQPLPLNLNVQVEQRDLAYYRAIGGA